MRGTTTFALRLAGLFGLGRAGVAPAAADRAADGPVGPVTVIDGDTVIVAGTRIRIHGIDAPELDQSFWLGGRTLPAGHMAMAALEALTAGVTARCAPIERDRHGRLVAKCFSPGGVDIGRRLVAAGWALAYRHYALDYVDAEDAARAAGRGLWRGTFHAPWAWRAQNDDRTVAVTTVTAVRFGRGGEPQRHPARRPSAR